MGGWKLEVAKMALYMAFPVGLFHYFNQPQLFENWVIKTKREIYPPDDSPHLIELRKGIKELQQYQELKHLEEMERSLKK